MPAKSQLGEKVDQSSVLNALKDKVIRIVLLTGKDKQRTKSPVAKSPLKQPQYPLTQQMLDEVDAAIKKSKLFSMTQLAEHQAGFWEERRSRDRDVIDSTIKEVTGTQNSLRVSMSTSSFQSRLSKDSDYQPEKSQLSRNAERSKEAQKLLGFQRYLAREINDVAAFKRFLGQLRESLKNQSKEQRRLHVSQHDRLSHERQAKDYVSDNFYVPRPNPSKVGSRHQSRPRAAGSSSPGRRNKESCLSARDRRQVPSVDSATEVPRSDAQNEATLSHAIQILDHQESSLDSNPASQAQSQQPPPRLSARESQRHRI